MNGALIVIKPTGSESSPNVAQPVADRIATLPQSSAGNAMLWVAALGAGSTMDVWFAPLGDSPPTWFKLTTAAAISPGDKAAVTLPLGSVPAGMPLFVQVTTIGSATLVCAGLTRA
jgi:hypothetical protein